MDSDLAIKRQFALTAQAGDLVEVRRMTKSYPILREQELLNMHLKSAAGRNNVPMMELLIELGASIHARSNPFGDDPETIIDPVASNGALDATRWLLDQGSKINFAKDGVTRCFPLTGAVLGGHFEVVRLLVERGADVNATWNGMNALAFAVMWNQPEIADYLRSVGATLPDGFDPNPPQERGTFLEHLAEHLGPPEPLSLQEIVPSDLPITIHRVVLDDRQALITEGMSARPMTVPDGEEEFRFAELVIYLPVGWPVDAKALRDPLWSWPIEWLRRIARYPHDHNTWLGGRSVVFANDEPPRPLARNTEMTCLLAMIEASDFGTHHRADDEAVRLYTLFPISTAERDFERQHGTYSLVERFEQSGISRVVDRKRRSVV